MTLRTTDGGKPGPDAEDDAQDEPRAERSEQDGPADTTDGADTADTADTADGADDEQAKALTLKIAIRVPGRAALARTLVVVALAAAVITALAQWHRADTLNRREAVRRQITATAGQFGQALLSYDHTHLDTARKRVLDLATDDFGRTYDVAFTGGLEGAITKLKADATATIRAVYLDGVGSDGAKAVVVMDSQVTSTAGTRNVLGSYLQMNLTRQGGRWRVSAVNSIGAINESLAPNGPGATTPTTSVSPAPGASAKP